MGYIVFTFLTLVALVILVEGQKCCGPQITTSNISNSIAIAFNSRRNNRDFLHLGRHFVPNHINRRHHFHGHGQIMIFGSAQSNLTGGLSSQTVQVAVSFGRYEKFFSLLLLDNFGEKKRYVVKDGKCFKRSLDRKPPNGCIPDKAPLLGTSQLGYGDDSLEVDNYGFRIAKRRARVDAMVTVTHNDCVPISIGYQMKSRVADAVGQITVYNIAETIADPSLFEVPSECKEVSEESDALKEDEDLETTLLHLDIMHTL